MIICRWITHRMINVSDKTCRENQNTNFVFRNFFFRKLCCLWENMEKYCRAGRPQMTILYGASTLHVGKLRLQTHSLNLQDVLLLHSDNSFTNAPQNYVYTYIVCLFGFIRMSTRKNSCRYHDHILSNTCLSLFTITFRMI